MPQLQICYHDHCFDGVASAATFLRFYREKVRPLSDVAREKIVDSWIDAGRGRGVPKPTRLELTLPAGERAEGLEPTILAAFRHDMEAMVVDSRRHWLRRRFPIRYAA